MMLLACFFAGPLLMANDDVFSLDGKTFEDIIATVVHKKPADKHIMYVNMVFFQLKNEIRYSDSALKQLIRVLSRTKDNKFEKLYGVDARYRHWMVENLEELRVFNRQKDEDILQLAMDMDDAGHTIGETLNNLPSFKLLYLIKYLTGGIERKVIERPDRKGISTSQLLVVLQAEQNSRNKRR